MLAGVTKQQSINRAISWTKVKTLCPTLEQELQEGPNYGLGHHNNMAFCEPSIWNNETSSLPINHYSPFIGFVATVARLPPNAVTKKDTPNLTERLKNKIIARDRICKANIAIIDMSTIPLFQNIGKEKVYRNNKETGERYPVYVE